MRKSLDTSFVYFYFIYIFCSAAHRGGQCAIGWGRAGLSNEGAMNKRLSA